MLKRWSGHYRTEKPMVYIGGDRLKEIARLMMDADPIECVVHINGTFLACRRSNMAMSCHPTAKHRDRDFSVWCGGVSDLEVRDWWR
jgi:hypothetical protein